MYFFDLVFFSGIAKECQLSARSHNENDASASADIFECYELAGSICIRYLQEVETGLPENLQPIGLPKSVDMAIKRQVVSSLQRK